jgi:hypothetical protein
MSNMSYCRFENTLKNFTECHSVLIDLIDGSEKPLSERELQSAIYLAKEVFQFVETIAEYNSPFVNNFIQNYYKSKDTNNCILTDSIKKINQEAKDEKVFN